MVTVAAVAGGMWASPRVSPQTGAAAGEMLHDRVPALAEMAVGDERVE